MATQYEYSSSAYPDERVDNIVRQDGVVDQLEVLALDIPEGDLIHNLHQRIEDSLSYWNKPTSLNLKSRRDKNINWHKGNHRDQTYMFAYQVPYTDNEIFVGVEALVSYLTAQTARCEVSPGNSEQGSRVLATDVEDLLNHLADIGDLQEESVSIVRDLLLKYIGVIKFWWDDDQKQICFGAVDPNNLIIDKNVRRGKNPAFICQVIKASVGELLSKFPGKREEIFKALGRKNASTKLLSQIVVYREVWFTYFKDNVPIEGVVSYFEDIVLEKTKNPHWNYEDEASNILALPLKPFIPFNFINDGSHWVDITTPVEQAGPLQEILNKRGQQILENADTANGVLAFDAKVITSDAAANLTGDPNQRILLEANKHGMTLNDAMMQLTPHMLPNYVIEDKTDLRQTIHNILGTPSQFTGTNAQDDKSDTLGESMMIKNQATGRQDAIIRALNAGYKRFFQYYAQMVKVWCTDPKQLSIKGKDGDFVDVELSSDRVEKNIIINIENSSFIPPDKQTTANIAMKLASLGLIDPYNLYKDLGLKEAQERFDALMKWKTNPMSLSEEIQTKEADRTAYIDFVDIMGGKKIEPRQDITPEHLNSHRDQMLDPSFTNAKNNIKNEFIKHVSAEKDILDQRSLIDEMAQQEAAAHQLPLGGAQPPMGPPGMPPMPSQGQQGPPPGMPQGMPPMSAQGLMQVH